MTNLQDAAHRHIDELTARRGLYGGQRARPASASHAHAWLDAMEAECAYGWVAPHVSADEDGLITFEWWVGSRKVTVYVEEPPVAPWCLRVWGPDVITEMEEAPVDTPEARAAVWGFLHGRETA
jgi:hypothetical protein